MDDEQQSQQTILFRWQWNKKLLCFVLIFLPLTVSLGFWQLRRAEQMQTILVAQQQRVDAAEVEFSNIALETDNQFKNVVISGEGIESQVFLVDNRMRHARSGFEVLMLLKVKVGDSIQGLLVNRGWLAGGVDRRALPEVPQIEPGAIRGYLYRSPGKSIVLKDERWEEDISPLVIQSIDLEKIAAYLSLDIYPYILRVVEGTAVNGENAVSWGAPLETDWLVVNSLPEKNIAYAVQWFAMALALMVLTIFANSNLAEVLRRSKQEIDGE